MYSCESYTSVEKGTLRASRADRRWNRNPDVRGGGGLFSKSITLYTLYSLSIYIERKIYVYTSYIFVEAEYCAGVNPIDKEYRVYNGMDLG